MNEENKQENLIENKDGSLPSDLSVGNVKQNKPSRNVVPIVAVLVLVIAAVMGLNYYLNTPKNIMLKSINNSYKEATNWFNEIRGGEIATLAQNSTIKTTSDITFDLKLRSNQYNEYNDIATVINNFKIKLINTEDEKNKERLTNVGLYSDLDLLVDVVQYAKDKSNYIYAKEIFDKYIKLADTDYISYYDAKSTADISYLVNKVKDLTIAQLKDSDFTKKSDKIKVDSKELSVSKVTLKINDKRANEILIGVAEGLKSDKKSVTVIADFYGEEILDNYKAEDLESAPKTKEDAVKKALNDYIKEIKANEETSDDYLYLSVYTTGITNKLVRYEFSQKNETGVISYTTYKNKDGETVRDIAYYDDSSTGVIIRFIANEKDTDFIMYDVTDNKESKLIDGVISNTVKETKSDKQFDSTQKIVMNLYEETTQPVVTFTISSNTITEIGAELNDPYVTNAVDVNNLTEEDSALISKNIEEVMTKILYKLIPQPTY